MKRKLLTWIAEGTASLLSLLGAYVAWLLLDAALIRRAPAMGEYLTRALGVQPLDVEWFLILISILLVSIAAAGLFLLQMKAVAKLWPGILAEWLSRRTKATQTKNG